MATLKTINKEMPFSVSVSGFLAMNFRTKIECVKQTIDSRLKSFKTEFYYNKDFGPDWYGVILNPASQPIERESELNDVVSGTAGVNSLVSSNLLIDKINQDQHYTAQVVADGIIVDVSQAFPNNQTGVTT